MEKEINIKYFSKDIAKMQMPDLSGWCDLCSAENVSLKAGEQRMVSLGVGMALPSGYEAHIAPQSTTYEKWGIILADQMSIIDESYCEKDAVWKANILAFRDTEIKVNDRICRFRIVEKQPKLKFIEVKNLF